MPTTQPNLHLIRIPGERGQVVRCSGVLTIATVEALRRELDLQFFLGHPVLFLNLSCCRSIDVDGILLIVDTAQRLREVGRQLAIVIGQAAIAPLLEAIGIDWVVPLFPTEQAAEKAIRGGGFPERTPESWKVAQSESLVRWRGILAMLEESPADELVRQVSRWHGFCQRAEVLSQDNQTRDAPRCHLCPLFHALGGTPPDVGCQSVLQPLQEALFSNNREAARRQVLRLLELMENAPLPEE